MLWGPSYGEEYEETGVSTLYTVHLYSVHDDSYTLFSYVGVMFYQDVKRNKLFLD